MAKKVDQKENPGYGWEYSAIKSEMLKRIEMRQQLISITLTLAGIFLSVGLTSEMVTLVYPPIAMFLAFGWSQNDFRIRRMAQYIRENLENLNIGLNYETAMQEDRVKNPSIATWRFLVISHSGIFLFTQIMAVGVDLLRSGIQFNPLRIGLLIVDALSMILVAWITFKSAR
jgi:uncharacterized membrane protein YqaE (UPF0057 family)